MSMQAEGLYQALFQHAGDAIVVIDAAMMAIVAANPAAERLSGYTQADLRALEPASLIMPVLVGNLRQYDGSLRVRGGQILPQQLLRGEIGRRRQLIILQKIAQRMLAILANRRL